MKKTEVKPMKQTEAQLKRTIEGFLAIQENMGNLSFERQNAGSFPTQSGNWAKGAKKGAADFRIDKASKYDGVAKFRYCRSIHIELKGKGGKQSQDQKDCQARVEAQHAEYHIIRSLEELGEVLRNE